MANLRIGCLAARIIRPDIPLRYFHSSPDIMRMLVMFCVRNPLLLRNVEDLQFERGIGLCHATVRLGWNRFGPLFAADIHRQRVSRIKGFRRWRWHRVETSVTFIGEIVYLWRAGDHEGEILKSYVTR